VATRYQNGEVFILPGARGPDYELANSVYSPLVDGCRALADDPTLCAMSNVDPVTGIPNGARSLINPFFDPASQFFQGSSEEYSQLFRTEMAALSFNAMMAFVALSTGDDAVNPTPSISEFSGAVPFRTDGCSFAKPYFCSNVQSIYQVTGIQRNIVRAGGNKSFGRRDFVWHGGTPLALRYEKRNVLGFSTDFAEDTTKTNWGAEFTWIEGLPFTDQDERDRLTDADTFNLTVSIDRPTFINFLNPNRTFFFNSQLFFQYVDGYNKGFTTNGPWSMLGTFTIQTGFFRDRFLPNMTFVYDVRSSSGAWLPSFQYRFTENFSATVGLATFWGREQGKRMAISPTSLSNRAARHAYTDYTDNGLSVVRERDEVFLRVRYTF